MWSQNNYNNTYRMRAETATTDLQHLFESPSTSIEEILSFPNIISELQTPINTHDFFSNDRIEHLIALVFEPSALKKYTFDEGRKYAFISSELLSAKIPSISEHFFHREAIGNFRKSLKVDECQMENDFEVGKDFLLSPGNSIKSKTTNYVEVCNKNAINFLVSKALNKQNLDETRAGYFSKILTAFFQKSKNEFLSYFYKSGSDFLKFAGFLEYYSVADFLNNVVLYENCLNSDSMIFQESQVQINPDFSAARIELFLKLLTNESLKSSFEVASNVKILIESFFSKFKNISDIEEIMQQIFIKYRYFAMLKTALTESKKNEVRFEILSIVKIITHFLVFASTAKTEVMSENTKSLFKSGTASYEEFVSLINCIKFYSNNQIQQNYWTNSFTNQSNSADIKTEICVLAILRNLIKQKVTAIHETFLNRNFIFSFLVFLLESFRTLSNEQSISQRFP